MELPAVSLDKTTSDDHVLEFPTRLALQLSANRVARLLLGWPDKGAGVDDHRSGNLRIPGDEQSLFRHPPKDQLGVDKVPGTTQVNERDSLRVDHLDTDRSPGSPWAGGGKLLRTDRGEPLLAVHEYIALLAIDIRSDETQLL